MADKKILVVDDEEGIRRVLRLSLSESGYRVLTAGTAADALEIIRVERPSIVLADIIMPGTDGIELLRRIKKESPETDVIMMTGHVDRQLAINSLRCEAAGFIAKPVSYDAVETALKRLCGQDHPFGHSLEDRGFEEGFGRNKSGKGS